MSSSQLVERAAAVLRHVLRPLVASLAALRAARQHPAGAGACAFSSLSIGNTERGGWRTRRFVSSVCSNVVGRHCWSTRCWRVWSTRSSARITWWSTNGV